MDPVRGL